MTTIMFAKACVLVLQIRASLLFVVPPTGEIGENSFQPDAINHQPLLLESDAPALGPSLLNVRPRKDSQSYAQASRNDDFIQKRFCKKAKLRPVLSKAEDYIAKGESVNHLILAQRHEEDYEGFEAFEGVKTYLDQQQPGCGPPIDVEAKIVNQSAIQINWRSETPPQNNSIRYFTLRYKQADKEDKPVTKCSQMIEYKSDKKSGNFTHHSAIFNDLTSDYKYQFQVATYYHDYQIYAAPKTAWLYLPSDGQAPRVTNPSGVTSK